VNRKELQDQIIFDIEREELDIVNLHLSLASPEVRIIQRE